MIEFVKRGERDKVAFLENELKNRVLPMHLERIRQNDKTVQKDLVLPNWVDWDLLYEWAMRMQVPKKGVQCILCNEYAERGTDFNSKFICDSCFFRIKSM